MDDAPPSQPAPFGNVPEYSVSEISGAIKRTLEGAFGRVRVRGEITEFKRYASGHLYFSLKDEGGKISGVVWRGSVSRVGLVPENGLEIIASGRVSSYGERSSYQLIVEKMEYAGEGALLARIERLRQRLAEEGLLDAARKRPIPRLPQLIGVVTSAHGAVLHDIRTTIARRFPRDVLLWPVAVQGEGAAAQIAAAVDGFNRLPPREPGVTSDLVRPDVLIVARGGGSLEDLMAFNDESVLRAVAASGIPVISAVGHETDTTLVDFVSDIRAPTPTAAAELAVPGRDELMADLAHRAARMSSALNRIGQTARLRLDRAARGVPDLPSLLDAGRMRLDDRSHRLDIALPALLERRRTSLIAAERHMPAPAALLSDHGARLKLRAASLTAAAAAMTHAMEMRLARTRLSAAPLNALCRERQARLTGVAGQLNAVSPMAVLERGYVLVRDARGAPVTRADGARPGAHVTLVFADGETGATVDRRANPAQTALDF